MGTRSVHRCFIVGIFIAANGRCDSSCFIELQNIPQIKTYQKGREIVILKVFGFLPSEP